MNLQSGINNKVLEVVHVASKKVACEGVKSGSTHPLVYLNMGKEDHAICPYCSRYFTIKPKASPLGQALKIK